MRRKLAFVILLAALLTLVGCEREGAPPIKATYESDAGEVLAEDEKVLLTWSWSYPVFSGIPGQEEINAFYVDARERFESAREEAADMARDASKYGGIYPYDEYWSAAPVRMDEILVSVVNERYSFYGGAHGLSDISYETFDAQTGARLGLADLSGDEDALRAYLTEALLELSKSDAYDPSPFFEGYEKDIPSLLEDDLWCFDGTGMTFMANTYVLSPYVAGPISFTIPYAELREHIDGQWLPSDT